MNSSLQFEKAGPGATAAALSRGHPMGTDGSEFIEHAVPDPKSIGEVFIELAQTRRGVLDKHEPK